MNILNVKLSHNITNQERLTIYKKKHVESLHMSQAKLVHMVIAEFHLGKPPTQLTTNS
jgi:hypothetical protein